jgi:catechol 2,3-dioxygenase-like lactoylglutathione lyase family enzyme
MIKLAGIGHVRLKVADEEASKRFYRDVLGFLIAEQDPSIQSSEWAARPSAPTRQSRYSVRSIPPENSR